MTPQATLPEEDRAGRVEPDQEGDHRHHRQEQQQAGRRPHQVEHPLGGRMHGVGLDGRSPRNDRFRKRASLSRQRIELERSLCRTVAHVVATCSDEVFELRLYVAGRTPKSLAALANLERVCEEHIAGRYTIEVIDLLQQPARARADQIVAIPTLVRNLPTPIRKIIGDLSNTERVLVGLDLREE